MIRNKFLSGPAGAILFGERTRSVVDCVRRLDDILPGVIQYLSFRHIRRLGLPKMARSGHRALCFEVEEDLVLLPVRRDRHRRMQN